jgi:enoyl-CoA hydratase/carnithine racemase
MVAVYAGLAAEVLDSGLVSLADHALAVGTALATASPYDLMNEIGTDRALTLVRSYAERRPGFRVAGALERQGAAGEPWAPPVVLRRNEGDVAILTIRRPDVLNALHSSVLEQIERHVLAIRDDAAIAAVVLTGFGTRAFVAGADIRELATLGNAGAIRRHVQLGHRVLDGIEALGKPVVCAMNGVAFGGGMELALACTTRIAPRGLRALAGQPEPKLGFIPGFGATQRLPRLIGFEAAWTMLRTAEPVSSAVAREIGLVAEEVEGDLLDRAVALAREIAAGRTAPPRPTRGPIPIPDSLPEVDIGPLSRRIDEILRTTVIDGCRLPLPEALRLEIDRIVSCQGTRDMRIGIEHYVRNGPKSPAPFVHA